MKPFDPAAVLLMLVAGCVSALAQPAIPPAPSAAAGRGFASPGATLAGQILTQADKNADQRLTKEEFTTLAEAWFNQLDPERIGRVTQEEFLQSFDAVASPQPAAGAGGRGGRGGRGGGGTGGTPLAFFTIADENRDASLQRAELKGSFEKWFLAWDADKDDRLASDEIAKGLNAILPRNNTSGTTGLTTMEPIPGLPVPPPSPILAPAESMATMRLVDGFKLELAASEPMIEDPVALSFDEDGRAYVVEMRGYMLDIDRTGEREPVSRISRLEDTDGDGRFDRSTVFVDKLILPRAVAAMAGGIFYVSDYQLYFARDTDGDGRADRTELVDADYGRGNVEHAPNAFYRAMDNWIYNGESPVRYRFVNGTLVRQTTEIRGQWGMTQDNHGRLHYNVNNSQLLGDFAPPNFMGRNAHHSSSAGLNLFVSTDQRVFPIRMNTAVNRGYSPEVLDAKTGRAFVFASSCSPVVYRGDNFPAEFVGNVFVADPALNLIKRNLVSDRNLTLTSRFAYDDREFLASTDERFRPSNLYNGPDGALWVVDLYHGIAQYSQFMTAYLRRESLARGLDKGIHHGRIYRVVSTAKPPAAFPRLARETAATLVTRLSHPNGWIRDTAQRLLVERGDRSVALALAQLVERSDNALARIHALWTLEGLFASLQEQIPPAPIDRVRLLKADPHFSLVAPAVPTEILRTCLKAIADSDPNVQVAAIRVAEALTSGNAPARTTLLQELVRVADTAPDATKFQVALTAGNLAKPEALPLLARIATDSSEHLLIRESIVSGLQNSELQFLQRLLSERQWAEQKPGRAALLQALASAVIKERQPDKIGALLTLAAGQLPAQAWRQRGLLDGIAANTRVRPLRPIALTRAPAALDAFAKSADPKIQQQSEQIKSLFAWPGSQPNDIAPKPAGARALTAAEEMAVAAGGTIYQQLCFACHGLTGQGTVPMGPPLLNSDWVLGSESRLIRILLQGMAGPVTVSGTTYQPPNILPEMPPLATLDDRQIANVLSYVRRAWGHEAAPISPEQVAAARKETQDRKSAWTEAQLLEIK